MKTVFLTHGSDPACDDFEPCVLALGFFDGVHKGHRKVIEAAKHAAMERKVKSAVMTFFPHPKEVISGGKDTVDYLIPFHKKEELISQLGVDILYAVTFNLEFAHLSAREFVQRYIISLKAIHVVAGFDFKYGYRGQGTMSTITADGMEQFGVTIIPEISWNEKKISSTYIRELLQKGKVSKIPPLLGGYYETCGDIAFTHRHSKGKATLEITLHDKYLLPACGIYEVEWKLGESVDRGIAILSKGQGKDKLLRLKKADIILFEGTLVKIKWLRRITSNINSMDEDPVTLFG